MEYNLKETEYYCSKCKQYFILMSLSPSCPNCGSVLYVALRSILDGTRITGNDELANTDFRAASRVRKS
jgi:DNA-directed RNA polymerase subunit RPC12/RpoP